MNCPPMPARLAATLLLLAGLLGGCSTLNREGTPAETEAGPGAGQAARLLRMGDDAAAAGDVATAASLYGRALALAPGDVDAARRLGEALLRAGRHQEAIEAFRRVLAARPGDPEASRGSARALLAIGRPDAALARLEEAAALAPDDPRLLNARAVALDQLGRHAEAQELYRAGLARWPENPALRNNLGLSLTLAGRFEEAVAELQPLASGPQASPRARHNLAAAYALAGDVRAAEALLRPDLDDRDLRSSLAYYAALRGLGPQRSPRVARALLAPPEAGRAETPAEAPAAQVAPPARRAGTTPVVVAGLEAGAAGAVGGSASGAPAGDGPGPAVAPRPQAALLRTRLAAPEAEPAMAAAMAADIPARPGGDGIAGPVGVATTPAVAANEAPPTPAEAAGANGARLQPPVGVAANAASTPAESIATGPATSAAIEPASDVAAGSLPPDGPGGTVPATVGEQLTEPVGFPEPAAGPPTLPLAVEPARGGDWLVELGTDAEGDPRARWRALREAHGELLDGVARLAGTGRNGPLLAGPFADRAAAELLCARLAAAGGCRPVRL